MYSCRSCKGNKFTEDQMKKEKYLNANKRGICKPCCTEYEKNQQLIRKANRNPDDYLSCDDCDRVFAKRSVGNSAGNNQYMIKNRDRFTLRVDCPFCKSENISRF